MNLARITPLWILACSRRSRRRQRAQEWKPARNVDIVVASGAGGSSDRTARVVQKLLQANPAFPSISVTNRPGGGGTVAWTLPRPAAGRPALHRHLLADHGHQPAARHHQAALQRLHPAQHPPAGVHPGDGECRLADRLGQGPARGHSEGPGGAELRVRGVPGQPQPRRHRHDLQGRRRRPQAGQGRHPEIRREPARPR